jgi:hypothetical protein
MASFEGETISRIARIEAIMAMNAQIRYGNSSLKSIRLKASIGPMILAKLPTL